MLAVMAASGLALAAVEHGVGPLTPWLFDRTELEDLFEGPHEVLFLGVLAFIVVHIGAMLLHEWKDGVPVAQEMVSGYQYKKVESNPEETKLGATDEK
jgi:cytochrome b561